MLRRLIFVAAAVIVVVFLGLIGWVQWQESLPTPEKLRTVPVEDGL